MNLIAKIKARVAYRRGVGLDYISDVSVVDLEKLVAYVEAVEYIHEKLEMTMTQDFKSARRGLGIGKE